VVVGHFFWCKKRLRPWGGGGSLLYSFQDGEVDPLVA
jgi:hypothetical protein